MACRGRRGRGGCPTCFQASCCTCGHAVRYLGPLICHFHHMDNLDACYQAWAVLYLAINLLTTSWALHFIAIGLLLCLVSYLRLPPPSPVLAAEILGPEPNSSDDTEVGFLSRMLSKSCLSKVCWEVAHRAACLDAPENSLEAVRSVENYWPSRKLNLTSQVGRCQWCQVGGVRCELHL